MQATCKSVQFTDVSNGTLVATTECDPDDSSNSSNIDNGTGSSSFTSAPPPPTATTTTDGGATIISTSIFTGSSTVTLTGPTETPNVDNSTSDGSANNDNSTDTGLGDSNSGVGMDIVANGTISASDVHPDPENVDPAALGLDKGKRFVVMSNVKQT